MQHKVDKDGLYIGKQTTGSEACIKPDMSNLPLCDDVESNLKSGSSLKHISDNIYYGTGKDGCPFKCRK